MRHVLVRPYLDVSHKAAAGADGYRLVESGTPEVAASRTRYVELGRTYVVTGQPEGQWQYRGAACNTVGPSEPSVVRSVSVTAAATGYVLGESASEWFAAPRLVCTGNATQTVRLDQSAGH